MSFDGQVDCQRMLIGPWAFAIIGKPSVAAPAVAAAAPARNLRREAVSVFLDCSLLIGSPSDGVHGWSSRRRSSCSPEPSAVNDSRGPFVPPAGPWGAYTPKPANRIPSPTRNQAGSGSE